MRQLFPLALLLYSGISHAAIAPQTLTEVKAIQFSEPNIATAGLPTPAQFVQLKEAGVDLVINLIPQGNPNGHDNEQALVTNAGMRYEGIEVDWEQPRLEDVTRFFEIMDAHKGQDILIHCVANYRASAFYYLYRSTRESDGEPVSMQQVMSPWGDLDSSLPQYPQWQQLIEQVTAQSAQ
ncbi:protein tyrosine phosphatase family protein [Shewanella colwelliana]|uniref:protein tyrosine phosphatase family protein n=1 Tax=Shewanella colwelliana TaxID=23 RepID=UPI0022AF5E99|nr:protein tyrosine phosphatase family protein [Shewanella colwelliana]MCZ4338544.1 protein tyrosine phosphatase family protein [Shewanella colwelliana]